MTESGVDVFLLADHPEFVEPLAALRFQEWGPEPGRELLADWVAVTTQEAGRDSLPVTFVAAHGGAVLGGVGLAVHDLPERRDRGPWIVGTIVAPAHRRTGVGAGLLACLEGHAVRLGATHVHVATGGAAIAFYQSCGWKIDETVPTRNGEHATVLNKPLTRPARGRGGSRSSG